MDDNYEFDGVPTLSHAVRTSLRIMIPVIIDEENERVVAVTEYSGWLDPKDIVPMPLRTIKRFCGWNEDLTGWRLKKDDTDTDTDTEVDAATWLEVTDVTSKDVNPTTTLVPPNAKRTDKEDRSTGLLMLVGQMIRDPSGFGVVFKPNTDVIKSLRPWHKPVIAVPWDVELLHKLGCQLTLDTRESSIGGSLRNPFKKGSDPDELCKRLERVITEAADEANHDLREADIRAASNRMLRKLRNSYSVSLNAHTLTGWTEYLAQLEGTNRFPLFTKGLRKYLENQGAIQTEVEATA